MESIVFENQSFAIDHLAPMPVTCRCLDIKRDLAISVAFSNHCYTESFDAERHEWRQVIIHDSPGKPRVFCPIRYDLSFRLPRIVAGLPSEKVYQTTVQRNYVYAAPLEIAGQDYEVYFMLQRAAKVEGVDLRMTIESAYPVDTPTLRPRRPREIRFTILARKVFLGQPIKFAPR